MKREGSPEPSRFIFSLSSFLRRQDKIADIYFEMLSSPRKRGSRIYMVSRALRAISKPKLRVAPPLHPSSVVSPSATYNLWVADPRQVAFLCLPKEKRPKERAPRSRRKLPVLLAGHRRVPQLAGRQQHGSGSNTRHAKTPIACCDARRRLRGFENTSQ
jgi:hypothetical protein